MLPGYGWSPLLKGLPTKNWRDSFSGCTIPSCHLKSQSGSLMPFYRWVNIGNMLWQVWHRFKFNGSKMQSQVTPRCSWIFLQSQVTPRCSWIFLQSQVTPRCSWIFLQSQVTPRCNLTQSSRRLRLVAKGGNLFTAVAGYAPVLVY